MRKMLACLLVVVIVIGLCSCAAPEKSIVGTWKNQTTVLGIVTETTYTFNEDGTGIISNVLDISFTYSCYSEKLLITTSVLGIENTETYSYDFNGDKLLLIGENDIIELVRVK